LHMTLVNVVVAAVWHFTWQAGWSFGLRWFVCAGLLAIPYSLLGRGFETQIGRREYRYAS